MTLQQEPTYWGSLPAEIQLMILELIIREKNPRWASFAAVCKEWQVHIEKENFRQLKLRDTCLDEFKRMVIRQRDLVQHIQFIIQLPEYGCRGCKNRTTTDLEYPELSVIGDRIFKLFSVLGTWTPAASGITLELNAYSPSDSQHWSKEYYFISDDEGLKAATSTHGGDGGGISSKRHDPDHGWRNGQQIQTPPKSVIMEQFQNLDMGPRINYPRVDVVTCFVIRRQLRRSLRPRDIRLLFYSFPRLERMVYEPWRPWSPWIDTDLKFTSLLQYGLPDTFKRLSVFEDFKDIVALEAANRYNAPSSQIADTVRIMDDTSINELVRRIFDLKLEELVVSYMVNAEDFFSASIPKSYWNPFPTRPWERLQSLALTSQLLQPTISHPETNALLSRVGVSALQMPKLHTLALWNGTRGMAGAFIYRMHKDYATITWRGTWNHELSYEVIEAWRSVASTIHSVELRIEKQSIHDEIGSHGDAIYYLNLPCRVVEPASLWQIRRENAPHTTRVEGACFCLMDT